MGLFDKKYCDVCGEKIGLLGNRKLEDGNLCKKCASKLSPFFSERKSSTVEEIKKQLAYREDNQRQLASFRATRIMGDRMKVMVDELGKRFVITSSNDILKDNPDIINLSDVISCDLDLKVDDKEMKQKDSQGKEVSYNPPRYLYSYNFYIELAVNSPWFSQIRFRLNSRDIEIVDEFVGNGMGRVMGSRRQSMVHPEYNMDYRKYQQMADEIVAVLTGQPTARSVAANVINNMADGQGFVNSVVSGIGAGAGMAGAGMMQNPNMMQGQTGMQNGSWVCSCGMTNTGRFCQNCGSPQPAARRLRCSNCGWEPTDPTHLPKFCPQCGSPL